MIPHLNGSAFSAFPANHLRQPVDVEPLAAPSVLAAPVLPVPSLALALPSAEASAKSRTSRAFGAPDEQSNCHFFDDVTTPATKKKTVKKQSVERGAIGKLLDKHKH